MPPPPARGHATDRRGVVSPCRAALATNDYETGIKVSDEQLARVKLTLAKFHGEWNYTIRPGK